ncbi:MAG: DUF5110 domain-containing protein [Deltaproteobacteria bacterium]|nr:DUF5110 domain-containing protein [Deltaproteobacteria bacterium]
MQAAPPVTSKIGSFYLTQQKLGGGLWHFRLSKSEPDPAAPWVSSPMLAPEADWAGPHEGPESFLRISDVDSPAPILTITETTPDGAQVVFSISPFAPDGQFSGLTFFGDRYTDVVGVGADFSFSRMRINHLGERVMPGGPFGSILEGSPGPRASGVQAPVCFALGPGFQNAALLINETRPLAWDFSAKPWYVGPIGPLGPAESMDFFVILGQDLPSLRRIVMSLLGRSSLPPPDVFDPWIMGGRKSPNLTDEEILNSLATFKAGFESLTIMFDPSSAAPPQALAARLGLNLIATESPYLPTDSPFFDDMLKRGFLVRERGPNGPPMLVSYQNKQSALIDYTHSPAGTYWHSLNRASQVDSGVFLFNLVGGEPEIYSPTAWYQGETGDAIHSQYAWGPRFALKWMESFQTALAARPAYGRQAAPRLFAVSRAGMAGMGRFKAGILTIDPNPFFFTRNAGQARANLSLSGIDYYSTDVSPLLNSFQMDPASRNYEAWLANVALLNIPLVIPRQLLGNAWSRQILDLKASLAPYYYSLAYKSSQTGDPLVAPLLYHFQDDPKARDSSFEAMVGPSLLVPAGVRGNEETLLFHLPKGRWYNPYNHDVLTQEVGEEHSLPVKIRGLHMPPILFRSGTVIPMIADPSGPTRRQAILAFPGDEPTSFDWYEDNGKDLSHLNGAFAITPLELSAYVGEGEVVLTVKAQEGNMPGEKTNRSLWIEFVGIGNVGTATLDGEMHRRLNSEEMLLTMDSGWFSLGDGRLAFKTPPLDPTVDHTIVVQ